eukprot:15989-Pelagococcus_subviridis.AAC.1
MARSAALIGRVCGLALIGRVCGLAPAVRGRERGASGPGPGPAADCGRTTYFIRRAGGDAVGGSCSAAALAGAGARPKKSGRGADAGLDAGDPGSLARGFRLFAATRLLGSPGIAVVGRSPRDG